VAHRVAALGLGLAGILTSSLNALLGSVLVTAGVVIVMDRRGVFGRGLFRASVAFIASLFLVLFGAIGLLLGLIPTVICETEPCPVSAVADLAPPGAVVVLAGAAMLAWSVITARRHRHEMPPDR